MYFKNKIPRISRLDKYFKISSHMLWQSSSRSLVVILLIVLINVLDIGNLAGAGMSGQTQERLRALLLLVVDYALVDVHKTSLLRHWRLHAVSVLDLSIIKTLGRQYYCINVSILEYKNLGACDSW